MSQHGYTFEASGAFYVRYYVIENGKRKQRSHRLCKKDRATGHAKTTSDAVQLLAQEFMLKINREQHTARESLQSDMTVQAFWQMVYLPYCEEVLPVTGLPRLKASTLRGYTQIWNQHLKDHFGTKTLRNYEPEQGSRLLDSLTGKMNKTSLKHVRAIGSAIFARARAMGLIKANPWKDMPLPDDAIEPENTHHYTLEMAENIVSALVDHVDAQLAVTLACFLGLGPAEISGLQWGDVDNDWIHIRRNRMQGKVTTTKNKWRAAALPIVDQVRVPLELWREKSHTKADGDWVIPDLHNLTGRVIKPHIRGGQMCYACNTKPAPSGVEWRGLYAGRRGTVTNIIETTGSVAVAQRIARHKTADTTLRVYNKGISERGLLAGMETYQKALNGEKK